MVRALTLIEDFTGKAPSKKKSHSSNNKVDKFFDENKMQRQQTMYLNNYGDAVNIAKRLGVAMQLAIEETIENYYKKDRLP